jgi:mRNA-degrading endonuclease RelE of RelBE toxin-antitoxin system
MDLVIEKVARKVLGRIQPKLAASMLKKLEEIAVDAMAHHANVEAMQGIRNGFRLRQGGWRVIYEVDTKANVLRVTKIGPRGQVYR